MTRYTNQERLLAEEYANSQKLNSRIQVHKKYSTRNVDWHEWVFNKLPLTKNEQIIDIGCGAGHLWWENDVSSKTDINLVLNDLSPTMLREAKKNISTHPIQPSYVTADVQQLPFTNKTFDLTIANHMLYHVPKLQLATNELYRVLRPGGQIYAATNGASHMIELREFLDPFTNEDLTKDHRYDFTLEKGKELFEMFFKDVRIIRFNNQLRIPGPKPIIKYAVSWSVDRSEIEPLQNKLNEFYSANDVMVINKDVGLLIGRRE